LIRDQGQIALKIETGSDGVPYVLGYAVSEDTEGSFKQREVQDLYLHTSEKTIEDKEAAQVWRQYANNKSCTAWTHVNQKEYLDIESSLAKKYKPVGVKVQPVLVELLPEFRIERNIQGDPLAELPELPVYPPEFTPEKQYSWDQWKVIQEKHDTGFLTATEVSLIHWIMKEHEMGVAWNESQKGTFKPEYFPPVKFAVVLHTPWVEQNILIPPGLLPEICKIIQTKRDAGVYEPSNASYRLRWFCVLKKDRKSL
jgi:hypothetical protein